MPHGTDLRDLTAHRSVSKACGHFQRDGASQSICQGTLIVAFGLLWHLMQQEHPVSPKPPSLFWTVGCEGEDENELRKGIGWQLRGTVRVCGKKTATPGRIVLS